MVLNMAMIGKVFESQLPHSLDKKHAISYQQHAVERIRQLFAQALSYPLPKEKGTMVLLVIFFPLKLSTLM